MKEKAKKLDEFLPLIFLGCIILIFHVLFTRLFIKTDDGNFLGIISEPNFSYAGWLTERYNTVSGRTVGEFLLTFFLKHDLIFWKTINTVMIMYITCFWFRLSNVFAGEFDKTKRQIICCCGMFTMFVSCLNPGAFWYAGSFSYLWPFAGMLMTVAPLVFYIFEGKINGFRLLFSFFSAFIGTMQEQAAACCTVFYLLLLIVIIAQKKKINVLMFIPIIPILICDYHLFTAPGATGRNIMETQSAFPLYSEYNIIQKLSCGLAAFFANSYYISNFLIIAFVALLSIAISKNISKSTKIKNLLIVVNVFTAAMCVLVNYSIAITEKMLPHIIFRNAFYKNEFGFSFFVLYILGCILTVIIISMIIVLLYCHKKLGVTIGLCTAAGFCSAIVMSFSPTVFSSGQRVSFYTNMFVITACIILFSDLPKTKLTKLIYKAFVAYAVTTFFVDCFAYRLLEHPLMG